ncbi:MAG: PEP-CTERM sorting domain-containing protein [Propionivibrio sp.]|uniref:PEP-CTERM sorting domain-containing protein n=1 Tax=Propionivibrio sp. TaxID=2212460 RepID=UPI001A394067|nr:PEP-CTERM sorting domain-containing protein [Propionivibrio sp.]MBL8415625.1 PEP-CTERM sorting domain-containing protein [Propionivibrio sp.]
MKFSLKTLAAAVAMASAAGGASAAIDNGAGGNGELFFNIWDANGSYSRDLNISIDSFESLIAAPGDFHLTFNADTLLGNFFTGSSAAGTRTGAFKFNLVANDNSGARRLLSSFTEPAPLTTNTSTTIRTGTSATSTHIGFINSAMGANDSVAVNNSSSAWTGKAAFKDTVGGAINFSNAGGVTNNTFASGLSFMRIDAASTGSSASIYNQYLDIGAFGNSEVHVYFDANKALHIQSIAVVPEPESYAMLLAGLGMLGFMARRRLNNRV